MVYESTSHILKDNKGFRHPSHCSHRQVQNKFNVRTTKGHWKLNVSEFFISLKLDPLGLNQRLVYRS